MPVRHSPCLLIPPTLPPHSSVLSHSYLLLKRRRRSVAIARAACCHELFALPRGGPRKRKIPSFFGGYFQMEISAKSRSFLTSGVFESVRFKRKRGQVERVQAGLAVEEGGEASNPPRGGGGETEVDRSAPRASANEGHGAAKKPSALFGKRQKESRERSLARLNTSEWQRLRWRNFKSNTNFCH